MSAIWTTCIRHSVQHILLFCRGQQTTKICLTSTFRNQHYRLILTSSNKETGIGVPDIFIRQSKTRLSTDALRDILSHLIQKRLLFGHFSHIKRQIYKVLPVAVVHNPTSFHQNHFTSLCIIRSQTDKNITSFAEAITFLKVMQQEQLIFSTLFPKLAAVSASLIFTLKTHICIMFCIPVYMKVPIESAQTWPVKSTSMHVLRAVTFGFWLITSVSATQPTSPSTALS